MFKTTKMRRRLKVVVLFATLITFIVLFILFTLRVYNNDRRKNVYTRNSTKPEPGSWFSALDTSLLEVDAILRSLIRTRNKSCLYECEKLDKFSYNRRYPFFEEEFTIAEEGLKTWLKDTSVTSFCDSKLKIFDRKFAHMRNVTLHALKWDVINFAQGGEELNKFKDKYIRDDDNEILRPRKGLFTLSCTQHEYLDELSSDEVPLLKFVTFTKSNAEVDKLDKLDKRKYIVRPDYVSNFTIAIAREEYANMYHVTLHMFNIFLMLLAFKQQPFEISILILDGHPKAEIDDTLQTLFGPLIRIGQLKRPTFFKNLVMSLPENKSPLSKHGFLNLAYLEEFRSFVLNRHQIDNGGSLNCKELRITLIWRRDKVFHPRNMKGTIERKIFNEAELFSAIYEKFPGYCVLGFLFETLPMKEQLKIIKHTDILIGMHGAGLSHSLYLPKTSGLIELFPLKFRKIHGYYKMFEVIAKWRGLHYMFWENVNTEMEMNNYFTIVDTAKITELVENMIKILCG